MCEERRKFFIDFSPFDMEIMTKIPMTKLVYIICKFYWDSGHEKITLETVNSYLYYSPEITFETSEHIKEIRVSTRKGYNKQKFDSIYFNFEQNSEGKTKIIEQMGFGFKAWNFIYIIIVFLIGLDYAGKPYTTGISATFVFFVLLIPLYVAFILRIKKAAKNPSVAKYKKDFEEHIHKKEREMFPENY